MSREEKSAQGAIPQLAAVVVRVFPFWQHNPVTWFRQLEAQFAPAAITTDATRFNHALIGLDEETIGLVSGELEECSDDRD